jgi:hypothetical protein
MSSCKLSGTGSGAGGRPHAVALQGARELQREQRVAAGGRMEAA